MSRQEFEQAAQALERAFEIAREYVASLGERPVARSATQEQLETAFDPILPDQPSDPVAALDEWMQRAEPGIVASSGPRFFGYVQGGTTPAALAGDWLASALDQNAAMWPASPAGAQTEQIVIGWLAQLFGIPHDWSGAITSGATQANLVGLAAARQWAGMELGFDPSADGLGGKPPIPVVSSTEIHASAKKALGTLGLGRDSVRTVPAIEGSVDLDALERELASIDGPAIIVANAGEVNTGAFDRLDEIARLRDTHPGGAWMHVDGAFGLFAAASPRTSYLVSGIDMADSIAADAHKWLNVPYDSGFAFVRHADPLRGAFATGAAYIAPAGGWDPMSHLPEMSRRFRGLAAWCALRAYGRQGYRDLVERCLDNAAAFADWIEGKPDLELLAPTHLNIVCFRYAPEGMSNEQADVLNRQAVAEIQADGRAFVTGTVWNGRVAVRAAFDNWATSLDDVMILQETVEEIGERLQK